MEILKKWKFCLLFFYSLLINSSWYSVCTQKKNKTLLESCETKCLNGFKYTIGYIYIKCKVNINRFLCGPRPPEASVHVCVVVWSTPQSKDKQRREHTTLADSSTPAADKNSPGSRRRSLRGIVESAKIPRVTGDPVHPGFSHLSGAQHLGECGVCVTLSRSGGVADCLLFNNHMWAPHIWV